MTAAFVILVLAVFFCRHIARYVCGLR